MLPKAQTEQEKLKYLTFVQEAAKHAAPYASKAYDYAKENSGSLKPGVEAIEGTLKTVISPACDTFHNVPGEVLKFVDRKVIIIFSFSFPPNIITSILLIYHQKDLKFMNMVTG